MAKRKGFAGKVLVAIGLAMPFLFTALVVSEIVLRWTSTGIIRRPICGQFDRTLIMVFRPNCTSMERSSWNEYPFETNEDGIRDRPRSFFRSGAIYLLGDSHLQGYGLEVQKGIARRLESQLNNSLGAPLLNLGVQSYGPSQEALFARRMFPRYPLKGAVWFLNPTDVPDEIYFDFVRTHGPPDVQGTRFLQAIHEWSDRKSYLLSKIIEYFNMHLPYRRAMKGRSFLPERHCESIRRFSAELAKRKKPLIFVAMGHGPVSRNMPYKGAVPDWEAYEALLRCAKDTGNPVIRLIEKFAHAEDVYAPRDWHLNERGVGQFVDILAPQILRAFQAETKRLMRH